MPQKNLKQKAASGMVWTALQKYSTILGVNLKTNY